MKPEVRRFSRRLMVLIFLFLLWGVLAAFQLFRYTVLQREKLRAESARLAWREGVIPSVRGRITDSRGVPLIWSEMAFDLVLERMPPEETRREALFRTLRENTRAAFPRDALPCILIRNIRPDEMKELNGLCARFTGLRIVPRMERRHVEDYAVRHLAPLWEKKYDGILKGEPGRFHVMLDRRGQWLTDTLRIDGEPVPGGDVRLTQTLEQIRKEVRDDGTE